MYYIFLRGSLIWRCWTLKIAEHHQRTYRSYVLPSDLNPPYPRILSNFLGQGFDEQSNRAGLRGQPWVVPLSKWIVCDKWPLTLILAVGEEYSALIHLKKLLLNPNQKRTLYRYSQPTESNAFSASRLTTIAITFSAVMWLMTCSVVLKLSCFCLFCVKPVWSKSTSLGTVS